MYLEDMEKKDLKMLIQAYNKYVQEFDYIEENEKPISVEKFYDTKYQLLSQDDEYTKSAKTQKDDLYIVYSTDALENSSDKEHLAYCTNINFAHEIISGLEHNSELKYVLAKVELNSELLNESVFEKYDGVDGLEWKSTLSDIEYGKFPQKVDEDNVMLAYNSLKSTGSISSDILLKGLNYNNTSLSPQKQEILKNHVNSLVSEFKENFKQQDVDVKQKL